MKQPAMGDSSIMVNVQRAVQLAVLRAIERNGYARHSEIGVDSRDVERAVELLLGDGSIVMDPSRPLLAESRRCCSLTLAASG